MVQTLQHLQSHERHFQFVASSREVIELEGTVNARVSYANDIYSFFNLLAKRDGSKEQRSICITLNDIALCVRSFRLSDTKFVNTCQPC